MAVTVPLGEATGELANYAGGDEAEAAYVPRTGQKMVAESSSPFLLLHFVYHGSLILIDPKVLQKLHYTATMHSSLLTCAINFLFML